MRPLSSSEQRAVGEEAVALAFFLGQGIPDVEIAHADGQHTRLARNPNSDEIKERCMRTRLNNPSENEPVNGVDMACTPLDP